MHISNLAAVAITLLSVVWARAADDSNSIKWKKIVLSNTFYSEGANFGDFNHDGKMDVVSGPYWYEGPDFNPQKRHEFMPVKSFKPDNDYSENFFAFSYDFNGDGWDDILIIGFPGKEAFWYENPKGKDGHWVKHLAYDNVDDESPNFVDLFKNGKPVIVCCSHGYIGYAQPDYTAPDKPWTFHKVSPKGKYQKFTHGIGYGDVNGDGRNDILESNGWWEQPESLEGDAPWKFHAAKFFEPGFGDGCSQMYAYDVNGDGRPDVVCALQAHGYGLAWFEQKVDGSFDRHLIMDPKPAKDAKGVVFSQLHAVDLVDMNGDGLLDIVTGKRYFAHGSHGDVDAMGPAVLYWFELKRDGQNVSYVPHQIDNDSGVGTQVVAKRIDGQKIPSLVIGNKKGTFVFLPEK
ncbi:MAG TPA: VCBS repeat-containing protein [Tepidisphaeraceae bacterium]|jgi:hypothetical protein